MKSHAKRLGPGTDLLAEIVKFAGEHSVEAGVVVSAVGSLSEVNLRLAGANDTLLMRGAFEIVSITGTISINGCHVHLAVADETGAVRGGHLLGGNIVRTTAELVIGVLDRVTFERTLDPVTGFKELNVGSTRYD